MTLRERGIEPPPNSRYVLGDLDYNKANNIPAVSTLKTGPGETPIRQGGKKITRILQPKK
jgi:hypothetical protein